MLTTTNYKRALARQDEEIIAEPPRSNYLKYLPAIYGEHDFAGRFLLIFESILGPLESRIGELHKLYDPLNTPPDFLPWLASWLGLVLDENWPLERRRGLVREGATLYRWRGTKYGLARYLELYTGHKPAINDTAEGFTIGTGTKLGQNAVLGHAAPPHTFVVSFTLPAGTEQDFDETIVRQIIEAEKPAHAAYILEVR